MNDTERAQWVENDEGFYNDRRRSRLSVTAYVKANREDIDAHIKRVLDTPPATYRGY